MQDVSQMQRYLHLSEPNLQSQCQELSQISQEQNPILKVKEELELNKITEKTLTHNSLLLTDLENKKKPPKLDKLLSGLHNYLLWDKMEVDSYNCKSYLQESTKICWIAKIKREQWKNVPKRYLYESLELYEGVFEFLLNINIRNVGGHIVGREVECYEK